MLRLWGVVGGPAGGAGAGVEFAYAIFLNASVRGPFLPAYEARPWWRVFRDALAGDEGLGLLGTTVHCADLDAGNARSAHVQSMLLALRARELDGAAAPFFDLDRLRAVQGRRDLRRAAAVARDPRRGADLGVPARARRPRRAHPRAAGRRDRPDLRRPPRRDGAAARGRRYGEHKACGPSEAIFKTARSNSTATTSTGRPRAPRPRGPRARTTSSRNSRPTTAQQAPVADAQTAAATRDAHRADVGRRSRRGRPVERRVRRSSAQRVVGVALV